MSAKARRLRQMSAKSNDRDASGQQVGSPMYGIPAPTERGSGMLLSRSELGESASTSAVTQQGGWRPPGVSAVPQEDYRCMSIPSVILTPRREDLLDGSNILISPQASGLGAMPQFPALQDSYLGGVCGGPQLLRPNMVMP